MGLHKGILISVEGIEGTGKTTLVARLKAHYAERNVQLLTTREPGGTPHAELVRNILKSNHSQMSAISELLLMFASRSLHLDDFIKPKLQAGEVVLVDRYVDASYAYQSGGRQIDIDKIAWLDNLVCGQYQPNIVILLTCKPDIAMQRVKKRAEALDRIEHEELSFFERAQQVYLERVQSRENSLIINSEIGSDLVFEKAVAHLDAYIL
ncbi:dTMP kinase [Candidatus Comchoanobacter bicostacola]|uniref:Thymidylate kinase n=1 Tax=Candidatus Comchoanobacter bicostacola TaxID=2919598 RepID=A0ABY5DHC4_9GAMM|nr:dTMP kinase [Candidatus Comchoanobacter bicostacola]UTC24148.1 dTMP kinase [Candidatus Comchoanobacter bicostacola]